MKDEKFIVAISPESRPDDKFCYCGTKEAVARAFATDMGCSMNARSLKKIPKGLTLFWVTYDKENWRGSGWGASELFTNMREAKAWILNKIEEDYLDTGKVSFSIYPVYRITNKSVKQVEDHQERIDNVIEAINEAGNK